jgi:excisionase family DNA binding protein
VKQTADRIPCSVATVYALCAAGRLRHSRVGLGRGVIRISEEAIVEYLSSRETGPEQRAPPPAPRRKIVLHHLDMP